MRAKGNGSVKKTITLLGALGLGICIGVVGPRFFARHADSSWRTLHTKPNHFGLSYATDVIFSDLIMPEVRSVNGAAKFMDDIGPRETTQLGFIVNVDLDPLDLSKIPQRYKEEKKVTISGYETTELPTEKAYYEIAFEFDLKDKDGFTLKVLHANGSQSLESGIKNIFQAKIDEPIDYNTAIKLHEIWVYPSITECHTCMPRTSQTGGPNPNSPR
jgi:hypothetical protein